ncbi:MAG: hypothetical protein LBU07_01335 [Coriobacteriales bacterium]|nr:hypothetical protein [Coriobacteriales bacterium]
MTGESAIVVTYRMQRMDGITNCPSDLIDAYTTSDLYDADAGYKVYHLVSD